MMHEGPGGRAVGDNRPAIIASDTFQSPIHRSRLMAHWRGEYLAALGARDQKEKASVALYDACSSPAL